MGEVVRPTFGSGPRLVVSNLEPAPPRAVDIEEIDQLFVADFKWLYTDEDKEQHWARVRAANMQGETMTTYVMDILSNFVLKDESLQLRIEALKTTSLDELCGHLIDTDRLQWKAQPHWYGAVFVEIANRINAIVSIVDETTSVAQKKE